MDVTEFVRTRQSRWQRLSTLLDRVDAFGMKAISHDQANELFSLYRLVSSDLNLVQTRAGNPALVEHLEALVGRAYALLAVPRTFRPLSAWWRIIRHKFPAIIRRERRLLALSAGIFLTGVLFGLLATELMPQAAEIFLSPEHLKERPSERVADLEAIEREGRSRVDSIAGNALFGSFLFTHNIKVSILAFALGLTFGIGTSIMLFFNGAMLGSITALYRQDGELDFFLGWVGPHGALELPCIVFAGMAGFMMARAQFRRDQGTLRVQMRALRPILVEILIGLSSLLVIAGIIEGGFSQVNEPTISYPLKIAVAAALFLTLLGYLFWLPVQPASKGSAD